MTMSEKPRHTGNSADDSPCCTATAVVMPMHSDECDDGIPPASTCVMYPRRRRRRRRVSEWETCTGGE